MAKSRAQRKREHLIRNGKRDPELDRGKNPDFSVHQRRLPTLIERRNKKWRKREKHQLTRGYRGEGYSKVS